MNQIVIARSSSDEAIHLEIQPREARLSRNDAVER